MPWNTLPKFLICREECDSGEDDCTYVMHTQQPRFLMQFCPGGHDELLPIDAIPAEAMAASLRGQARRFFHDE